MYCLDTGGDPRVCANGPSEEYSLSVAAAVLVITLGMAVLQFTLKPFEESAEEASGGWRTSPNRQVCPAHMAPAIICLVPTELRLLTQRAVDAARAAG